MAGMSNGLLVLFLVVGVERVNTIIKPSRRTSAPTTPANSTASSSGTATPSRRRERNGVVSRKLLLDKNELLYQDSEYTKVSLSRDGQ